MIEDALAKIGDDQLAGGALQQAFAQALLEEQRVAVTPGEAFDAPGFLRISYATSMENLREGSRRLLEFVNARAGAGTQPHLASTTAR